MTILCYHSVQPEWDVTTGGASRQDFAEQCAWLAGTGGCCRWTRPSSGWTAPAGCPAGRPR